MKLGRKRRLAKLGWLGLQIGVALFVASQVLPTQEPWPALVFVSAPVLVLVCLAFAYIATGLVAALIDAFVSVEKGSP